MCAHTHTHPSLSECGATRLPQSKNGWADMRTVICAVMFIGRFCPPTLDTRGKTVVTLKEKNL